LDKGLVELIPAETVRQEALALLKWITISTQGQESNTWNTSRITNQGPGLDARYLAAFDSAMLKVCQTPQRYKIDFPPDIRRYRVPGFPYNILYRLADADIEVLVVAPHRRRPNYWRGRVWICRKV
jgi:plasmid stabilization system protein ParE